MRVSKIEGKELADGQDRYELENLTKLDAMTIMDALRGNRQNLLTEINKSAAMATETDESRMLEDLAFLGEVLGRVCRMELLLGETVDL
jgi:hypothetical protein